MKQLCLERFQSLSKEGLNSRFFDELGGIVFVHAQGLGMSDRQKILSNLELLWLPIALDLATRRNKLNRTLIQGILGGQGTGKSTLCSILEQILNYLCFSVATVSIDDLYKTYEERQALRKKNKSLIWRGPPG
ncbi:MAG: glycerate kinase, partial [Cyanobacteria bacterium J06631_2]